jgi:hypothetical protein
MIDRGVAAPMLQSGLGPNTARSIDCAHRTGTVSPHCSMSTVARPSCPAGGRKAPYRDEATGVVYHGAVLLAHGLPLDLPAGDYASTVVLLSRDQPST